MTETFNIFCDESCHLENDHQQVMVLGALWCPLDKTREISVRIREIKMHFGLSQNFEIKWKKVSTAKLPFYINILDYFFDDDDLHFRALVIPDKTKLRHYEFQQTHDDWYYKMFFDLLKVIISPDAHYRIYLDIKDTQSVRKVEKLHEVLSNEKYDFRREIIECIQNVRSHEVEQLQLADLLIGAVAYANRRMATSKAKLAFVDRLRKRSGYSLAQTTLYREDKVNIFHWKAKEV